MYKTPQSSNGGRTCIVLSIRCRGLTLFLKKVVMPKLCSIRVKDATCYFSNLFYPLLVCEMCARFTAPLGYKKTLGHSFTHRWLCWAYGYNWTGNHHALIHSYILFTWIKSVIFIYLSLTHAVASGGGAGRENVCFSCRFWPKHPEPFNRRIVDFVLD
jgi:hypothetical protein